MPDYIYDANAAVLVFSVFIGTSAFLSASSAYSARTNSEFPEIQFPGQAVEK